jgi:hypothetical protein
MDGSANAFREIPSEVDGAAAVELLRTIVKAHWFFMDRNDKGSHDEFQRAANAFYDSIDVAEVWMMTRGLLEKGGD